MEVYQKPNQKNCAEASYSFFYMDSLAFEACTKSPTHLTKISYDDFDVTRQSYTKFKMQISL